MSDSRHPLARASTAVLAWTAALATAALLVAGCGGDAEPAESAAAPPAAGPASAAAEVAQPPAAAGAMAPHLAAGADGVVLLSWLEPAGAGHRLRVARASGGAWSEAATVAAGEEFFANWADTPSVVEDGAGTLWAHWLEMIGEGTYAYGVQLARSDDGGASWQPLGLLHDDRSPTEHGFVTLLPTAGGGVDAVWLDGRRMTEGGAMTLRSRRLGDGAPSDDTEPRRGAAFAAESVIDPRVCDCCSTAAARSADGLVVAYRDRSAREVRDIAVSRRAGDGWSPPRPVHRDGWTIPGCPVNGPVLAADGRRTAAAWFTAADGTPRVLAAWSTDSGATWSPPAVIDAEEPLGRVGLALLPDGSAVVSWLAADGAVRLRRLLPDGRLGASTAVGMTATSRAAGFPRLVATGDRLHAAWVEPGGNDAPSRLRFTTLPSAAVPPPA